MNGLSLGVGAEFHSVDHLQLLGRQAGGFRHGDLGSAARDPVARRLDVNPGGRRAGLEHPVRNVARLEEGVSALGRLAVDAVDEVGVGLVVDRGGGPLEIVQDDSVADGRFVPVDENAGFVSGRGLSLVRYPPALLGFLFGAVESDELVDPHLRAKDVDVHGVRRRIEYERPLIERGVEVCCSVYVLVCFHVVSGEGDDHSICARIERGPADLFARGRQDRKAGGRTRVDHVGELDGDRVAAAGAVRHRPGEVEPD